MIQNLETNFLTDAESVSFTGAVDAAAVAAAFVTFANPNYQPHTFAEYGSTRYWDVRNLAKIYSFDPYSILQRLNVMKAAGTVAGPILAGIHG